MPSAGISTEARMTSSRLMGRVTEGAVTALAAGFCATPAGTRLDANPKHARPSAIAIFPLIRVIASPKGQHLSALLLAPARLQCHAGFPASPVAAVCVRPCRQHSDRHRDPTAGGHPPACVA